MSVSLSVDEPSSWSPISLPSKEEEPLINFFIFFLSLFFLFFLFLASLAGVVLSIKEVREEEEEIGSPLSPPLSIPWSIMGLRHIRAVWPGFLQLWQIFFWSSGQARRRWP